MRVGEEDFQLIEDNQQAADRQPAGAYPPLFRLRGAIESPLNGLGGGIRRLVGQRGEGFRRALRALRQFGKAGRVI